MASELAASEGGGPWLLLVEDSKVNQLLIQAIMEAAEYTIDIAGSGTEALERLAGTPYYLVLMDVSMPDMDGLEVTRKLREKKDGPNARVRVIALTAHAMEGDSEACLAAGMDDYLAKPINREELMQKLSLWVGKGSRT